MRLISLLLLTALFVTAFGDTWAPPKPRVFASENGSFGFKLASASPEMPERSWQGTLFRLDERGRDVVVWQRHLPNIPVRVFVSEQGHVVTVDTHGRVGFAHSLVVYGTDGTTLGDYRLEELLTEAEIARVPRSVSSRWWSPAGGYEVQGGLVRCSV